MSSQRWTLYCQLRLSAFSRFRQTSAAPSRMMVHACDQKHAGTVPDYLQVHAVVELFTLPGRHRSTIRQSRRYRRTDGGHSRQGLVPITRIVA